ncbi:signal peptide peptidase-like isoform X2 [Diospyros lotus]|uniref:signal peptide peptidase-like isoform X2 n=1 Tax=Diospyros lotus TaxID=55363 RepID=UPI002251189B|nr:signal peptide peptidase-like isoform X2 [Diospyros lotus]
MRNSERFANIALAGLTLAPLVIKVDPNLNVILTACLTVYVGCYRSVKPTPPSETMSNEHAMRFPLVGSAMLLSLFLLFKFLSKDLVNAVLTCYFFVLGIVALSATLLPAIRRFLPKHWNEDSIVWRFPYLRSYSIHSSASGLPLDPVMMGAAVERGGKSIGRLALGCRENIVSVALRCWLKPENSSLRPSCKASSFNSSCFILVPSAILLADTHNCFLPCSLEPPGQALEVEFTRSQIVAAIPGTFFCAWYASRKHWLANNILGLSFCIQGIEMLSLGSFKTGAILLAGLFVYDIFWVFFTPVMVSVAKSFDAPIKLLFPTADAARPYSMLGLGDIVIPGIFVALALRFDVSRGKASQYFKSAFLGYTVGLVLTIIVMNWFQAAQPALLYIVPAVIGFLAAHCMWNGDVKQLLEFDESRTSGGSSQEEDDAKLSKKTE